MARTELAHADLAERVASLDVSLFKAIKSQTKRGDRASLLALQAACGEQYGTFRYLEIGSHLGGSLQGFVRDPRCQSIVSIDLRPEVTPDDRGKGIPYQGNSTERMLELLRALPDADVEKIETIDADSRSIDPMTVGAPPQLCFIDGEHTYESCLADARFCRSVSGPDVTIGFHDTRIIYPAIREFLAELRANGERFVAYPLPDSVFVVDIGGARLHASAAMRRLVCGPENTLPRPAALLARRPASDANLMRRALLTGWLSELGAGSAKLTGRRRTLVKKARKTTSKQVKVRRRRVAKRLRRVISR